MNERQAAFLRQWHADWQAHQKEVQALRQQVAALEERVAEVERLITADCYDQIERLS